MKGYCKVTLNTFFKEKKIMMTKKFNPYNTLFVSNRNFTTKHVKNFPGKLATLLLKKCRIVIYHNAIF